ncbi:hypothetical protein ACXZ1K_00970 [Pedobacter sp. PWIIR3]
MKELNFMMPVEKPGKKNLESYLLGIILVLVWYTLPKLFAQMDGNIGTVDPGIWMLIVLSLLSFLMVIGMSWWLLHWSWCALGLPHLRTMVLQFKDLQLWQQLGFYLCCFALLVLAGVGALIAVL